MSSEKSSRAIVYSTPELFSREQQGGSRISKTAEVTGVSWCTELQIRREKKETRVLLSPKRSNKIKWRKILQKGEKLIEIKQKAF